MAEITAALVKELRETTGAGMMDCKRALTEADGNLQDAIDWLRKKGLSAAAKKSGRVAAEGLVGTASAPNRAAMVEVNAETDFVARNDAFQEFVATVARIALDAGEDIEVIKAAPYPGTGRNVAEEMTHLIATIGENMILRRARVLSVSSGVVACYVHGALKPGLGKIGCLVAVEAASELAALEVLGRQIGMHIAAARPDALDIDAVDPAALERERAVLSEQARARAASPRRSSRRWSMAACANTTRKSCCSSRSGCIDGETRVREVVKKAGAKLTGVCKVPAGRGRRSWAAGGFRGGSGGGRGRINKIGGDEPSPPYPPSSISPRINDDGGSGGNGSFPPAFYLPPNPFGTPTPVQKSHPATADAPPLLPHVPAVISVQSAVLVKSLYTVVNSFAVDLAKLPALLRMPASAGEDTLVPPSTIQS